MRKAVSFWELDGLARRLATKTTDSNVILRHVSHQRQPNSAAFPHSARRRMPTMEPEPYDTFPYEDFQSEDEIAPYYALDHAPNREQKDDSNREQKPAPYSKSYEESEPTLSIHDAEPSKLRGIPKKELDLMVFRLAKKVKQQTDEIPSIEDLEKMHSSLRPLANGMEFKEFVTIFHSTFEVVDPDFGPGKVERAYQDALGLPSPRLPKPAKQRVIDLAGTCSVLQLNNGKNSFPLCQKVYANMLNVTRHSVGRWLAQLRNMKVLKRTYKGHTNVSSQYLYLGDTAHLAEIDGSQATKHG